MNPWLHQRLQDSGAAEDAAPSAAQWRELLAALSTQLDLRDAQVTEAESTSATQTALHRSVLSALPDLYFQLDAQNRFVDFRAGNGSDLALPPEAFLGRRLDELPFGHELTRALCDTAESARTTGAVRSHTYSLEVNGEQNAYEVRFAPHQDGQLVALIRNHTHTRRLAEELQLTQFALDRLSDSAFWLAPDGRFVYVNDAMCRGLGYGREELLALRISDVAPELRSHTWPRLWSQFKERRSLTMESRQRRKDGSAFPAEIAIDHIEYAGKEYACAVARDISDRKRMQESLVLTNRLASLGTLAAAVAHEVNNPLAYMMINLDQVARRLGAATPPTGSELSDMAVAMGQARHGAERVRMIVRDLRTFSRGDDARMDLVDVRSVLSAAITVAQADIRHRAQLRTSFEDVPLVFANEARLGQVFLNLLVNAAQALDENTDGSGEIHVKVHSNGTLVFTEIADNGKGITPSVLPHVFEAFYTTKPAGVGTGLGLSICKNIIEACGGNISVVSERGRGATFTVVLPVTQGHRLQNTPPSSGHVVEHGARVLVADDEPFIIEAMRRALAGHQVSVCTNGRDALVLCERERFDVIFCDLVMPELGGIDVLKALQKSDPELAKRVVFMTGGVFTPQALDLLGSVENKLLEKPFSLEDVQRIVSDAIKAE
jgi:PAS domain S-box-containing protein